ncbi:hypothetical protein [Plantibacter sp. T3]|uniref:hypothetical protein n=1 Tax=Plantibacter sp. T3 TaxID=2653161 RepID=UPI0012F0F694|nr:hypothetical protein [Plantibacter sp. T3]VXC39328.1 conserved hypothetical protein [Plantibacter sp. T3]
MSETVVAAAIQHGAVVFTGTRHGLIIGQMVELGYLDPPSQSQRVAFEQQGFLTSEGRWVDRAEGMRLTVDAGQLEYREQFPELFSEDLW